MYKIRITRYKMDKSAQINLPPQMACLIFHISRLTGTMTLQFNWWMVIDVDNTTPKGFF